MRKKLNLANLKNGFSYTTLKLMIIQVSLLVMSGAVLAQDALKASSAGVGVHRLQFLINEAGDLFLVEGAQEDTSGRTEVADPPVVSEDGAAEIGEGQDLDKGVPPGGDVELYQIVMEPDEEEDDPHPDPGGNPSRATVYASRTKTQAVGSGTTSLDGPDGGNSVAGLSYTWALGHPIYQRLLSQFEGEAITFARAFRSDRAAWMVIQRGQASRAVYLRTIQNEKQVQVERLAEGRNLVMHSAVQTEDGGFLLAGYFTGRLRWGTEEKVARGGSDVFLAKLGANGVLDWLHQVSSAWDETLTSVTVDPQRNLCIQGSMRRPEEGHAFSYQICLDAEGQLQSKGLIFPE